MKFAIFGLSASVDIRQLPGAWVAELLGVKDHKKIKFPMVSILTLPMALKGLMDKKNFKGFQGKISLRKYLRIIRLVGFEIK